MQKPEKIPILFLETSQTFLDLSCGEQGFGFEVPALSMARSVKKPKPESKGPAEVGHFTLKNP